MLAIWGVVSLKKMSFPDSKTLQKDTKFRRLRRADKKKTFWPIQNKGESGRNSTDVPSVVMYLRLQSVAWQNQDQPTQKTTTRTSRCQVAANIIDLITCCTEPCFRSNIIFCMPVSVRIIPYERLYCKSRATGSLLHEQTFQGIILIVDLWLRVEGTLSLWRSPIPKRFGI